MSSGVTSLDFVGDIGSGGYEKETRDAEVIVYKVASVQGDITFSMLEFDVHCGGGQHGRHNQITPAALCTKIMNWLDAANNINPISRCCLTTL